ncbi:unnamed protein product [Amoebophrya sp. A120]|nr:unnamed protein product [Amoebophrya sp. A120]|eukprot:GSA120T00012534001.1
MASSSGAQQNSNHMDFLRRFAYAASSENSSSLGAVPGTPQNGPLSISIPMSPLNQHYGAATGVGFYNDSATPTPNGMMPFQGNGMLHGYSFPNTPAAMSSTSSSPQLFYHENQQQYHGSGNVGGASGDTSNSVMNNNFQQQRQPFFQHQSYGQAPPQHPQTALAAMSGGAGMMFMNSGGSFFNNGFNNNPVSTSAATTPGGQMQHSFSSPNVNSATGTMIGVVGGSANHNHASYLNSPFGASSSTTTSAGRPYFSYIGTAQNPHLKQPSKVEILNMYLHTVQGHAAGNGKNGAAKQSKDTPVLAENIWPLPVPVLPPGALDYLNGESALNVKASNTAPGTPFYNGAAHQQQAPFYPPSNGNIISQTAPYTPTTSTATSTIDNQTNSAFQSSMVNANNYEEGVSNRGSNSTNSSGPNFSKTPRGAGGSGRSLNNGGQHAAINNAMHSKYSSYSNSSNHTSPYNTKNSTSSPATLNTKTPSNATTVAGATSRLYDMFNANDEQG